MLDQSFSAENFFRIFHNENRKGTFNRDLLSEEYLTIHERVKHLFCDRRFFTKAQFKKKLKELNDLKEEALRKHLHLISETCNSRSFEFKLNMFQKEGKDIFTVNHDACSFFAMKQLQFNVFRTFKVKQASRYNIVKQLRILLEDGFPKIVIRIDIKGFYESIPHSILLKNIHENQLLNFHSKKLLKGLVFSYEHVKDKQTQMPGYGIPRGVGVSAYLSELYMRDLDNDMKALPDLGYYERYVDDAIFVFIPKSRDKILNYLQLIEAVINRFELSLKDGTDGGQNKIIELNLFSQNQKIEFDFLGYKFVIINKQLTELRLSDNKLIKYEERIKSTFEQYNKASKYNEKAARRLLFNRLKFLTGNFHLLNNKKRIKSGVYYANILIKDNYCESGEFKKLNEIMLNHLNKVFPSPGLKVNVEKLKKKILGRYNFHEGFYSRNKRFHSFTAAELNEIVLAWKV
jgi:hypothetical protein